MIHKSLLTLLGMTVFVWLSTSSALANSAPDVSVVRDRGTWKEFHAEALIDAPPATVWANLTDYGNMKNILPGYDRSTVLQSAGNTSTLDVGFKAAPMLPPFRYQVKIVEDSANQTVIIRRISGDFNHIKAVYRLYPLSNGTRTRMTYHLEIDLGKKILQMGSSQILKGNIRKGLVAMQSYCHQKHRRTITASAE